MKINHINYTVIESEVGEVKMQLTKHTLNLCKTTTFNHSQINIRGKDIDKFIKELQNMRKEMQ